MYVGSNGSDFATKLLGYLQKADYQVANTALERQQIYRLRYDAYLREGAIDENQTTMFHDSYDEMDNCWIFGVYLAGMLAASIRCHVTSPENPYGPALDVFPDIVAPMIHEEGLTVVDPTRFVVDYHMARQYPELPFMALRAVCMTYDFFEADYCLITVRKEHAAFYKRVVRAELVCEPRPYPSLKAPICLLKTNVASFRDQLFRRYPIFESSFTERRMMFDGPAPAFRYERPTENIAAFAN